jgi:hypothetical protein
VRSRHGVVESPADTQGPAHVNGENRTNLMIFIVVGIVLLATVCILGLAVWYPSSMGPAIGPSPQLTEFFGKDLNRADTFKFLAACDADPSHAGKTHAGLVVGLTGTVYVARWHSDRSEGLYAIMTISNPFRSRQMTVTGAFAPSEAAAVTALRNGDVATIRGTIASILSDKNGIQIDIDDAVVVSHSRDSSKTANSGPNDHLGPPVKDARPHRGEAVSK